MVIYGNIHKITHSNTELNYMTKRGFYVTLAHFNRLIGFQQIFKLFCTGNNPQKYQDNLLYLLASIYNLCHLELNNKCFGVRELDEQYIETLQLAADSSKYSQSIYQDSIFPVYFQLFLYPVT